MSDVENEKSEGLAYTKVFKGKHTLQNAHKLNPPGGLTYTRWPYCHRAMPLDFAHRADAQSGRAYRLRNLISQTYFGPIFIAPPLVKGIPSLQALNLGSA